MGAALVGGPRVGVHGEWQLTLAVIARGHNTMAPGQAVRHAGVVSKLRLRRAVHAVLEAEFVDGAIDVAGHNGISVGAARPQHEGVRAGIEAQALEATYRLAHATT